MPIAQICLEDQTRKDVPLDSERPHAAPGGIVWLDVDKPTEQDLTWLQHTYRFHPLAIEDARHFNQRAKVESYDGYLFLSLVTAVRDGEDIHPHEMEVFLGPDYLVTIHREELPAIASARAHVGANALVQGHPDLLLWTIVDAMVDLYFPMLDEMEDEIDRLEDEILENATQATLQRIYGLKRELVTLRKITAPMRDVMNALAGTRYPLIDQRTAFYFRDAYDHLTRIYDLIETSRDLLSNALDAYPSTVSNRLSEIMKRLTLFTTIFMPISFLVGLGGMNFVQMPFNSSLAFGIIIGLIIAVPIIMVIWFRRSKWV